MASPGTARDGSSGAELTARQRAIATRVEPALAVARELRTWFEQVEARGGPSRRFEVVTTFNRPDRSHAFFGLAPTAGGPLEVMGDVQDLFYDRPKSGGSAAMAAEWMRRQVREFVLHYFLRVSDFRKPEAFADAPSRSLPLPLRPFSWCPEPRPEREGFGYSQLLFRRPGEAVGAFPAAEGAAVLDLREVRRSYEWIVLEVRIFDFDLAFHPLGPELPRLEIPLREKQLVALAPDWVVDEDHPEAGVLGRYGFGYAVLEDPGDRGLLAYGPGHFAAGFQRFTFEVSGSGEVRLHVEFVVNRPQQVLRLPLDPLRWGLAAGDALSFGLASRLFGPLRQALAAPSPQGLAVDPVLGTIDALRLASGGLSERQLCISREQLEKEMLVQHYHQVYQLVTGSLLTWRQIPDWLDEAALPRWVKTGESS
jgi:hypothetical protein